MEILDPSVRDFYVRALRLMNDGDSPFVVGGAYALERHTGISRHTKDLDLFVAMTDVEEVLGRFRKEGFRTERTHPHWLAKVHHEGAFVDIIFRSGNGLAEVDARWFERGSDGEVFGVPVRLCAPEDMIWSKAFIMERERFDGADIAHLLRGCGPRLDWELLLALFDRYWRVLAAHVVLFGFIYPGERECIPAWVVTEFARRLERETASDSEEVGLCQGTLLSRSQYLIDINVCGYTDARLAPRGRMSASDVAAWTEAIARDGSL